LKRRFACVLCFRKQARYPSVGKGAKPVPAETPKETDLLDIIPKDIMTGGILSAYFQRLKEKSNRFSILLKRKHLEIWS
jgi:hypothetical protein